MILGLRRPNILHCSQTAGYLLFLHVLSLTLSVIGTQLDFPGMFVLSCSILRSYRRYGLTNEIKITRQHHPLLFLARVLHLDLSQSTLPLTIICPQRPLWDYTPDSVYSHDYGTSILSRSISNWTLTPSEVGLLYICILFRPKLVESSQRPFSFWQWPSCVQYIEFLCGFMLVACLSFDKFD